MGESSKIEWTDATWNPTRGCSRVSPGCDNCYAMRQAHRQNTPGGAYEGLTVLRPQTASRPGVDWSGRVRLVPEQLALPLRWRKPRRIFVDSMSDLFHPAISDAEILRVWLVMAQAYWHTFQVLTKRPERARAWFAKWADVEPPERDPVMARGPAAVRAAHTSGRALMFADVLESMGEPPPGCAFPTYDWAEGPRWLPTALGNVWIGTSVEDRARKGRIDELASIPAAVRFLSLEPLLEDLGELDLTGVDWVIVGGESGHGARPCHVDWIRSIVRQCAGANVACFVKQLGANVRDRNDVGFDGEPGDAWDMGARLFDAVEHDPDGVRNDYQGAPVRVHLSDRKGGDPSEWPANLRVREFPAARSAP